jgi:hypothetical protein
LLPGADLTSTLSEGKFKNYGLYVPSKHNHIHYYDDIKRIIKRNLNFKSAKSIETRACIDQQIKKIAQQEVST